VRGGEDLLVVAIGDTIVMKKLSAMSFDEVAKPIWRTVKAMGLSRGELDELVEEAKTKLVLDTNVWGSAFLAKGQASRVVQMAEDKLVQLSVSLENHR